MNLLSWNVRQLGGHGKIGSIRKLVMEMRVTFLGSSKTKTKDLVERRVRKLWGDDNFGWATMDANDQGGGGLLCIWGRQFL